MEMPPKDHRPEDPSAGEGSSDAAIGRPQLWREGRYQQVGRPVDAVDPAPGAPADAKQGTAAGREHTAPDARDIPVTRKDYENLQPPPVKPPPVKAPPPKASK